MKLRPYNPIFDRQPNGEKWETACWKNGHYWCYNLQCIVYDERPQEIGRLPFFNELTYTMYTPILRCPGCGRLYFGNDTPYEEESEPPAPNLPPQQPETQQPDSPEDNDDDIILPNLLTV